MCRSYFGILIGNRKAKTTSNPYAAVTLLCLEIFAPGANSPVARGPPKNGICSRQDAKNAKSGSNNFFAAFAGDIPKFGCGSAALG
jgi:hypothetical protein